MANQSTRLATTRHAPAREILELENRCTGNRTVGSKSHPLRDPSLVLKVLRVIFNLPHNLPHKIKCAAMQ